MAALNQMEKNILKKIAEYHLISKPELRRFIETNGSTGKDMSSAVDAITRHLAEQRLITPINPIGSTCFVITQRGSQFLKDIEV